jgi:inosine-uridine nucleoside N-ribohydrolase
MNKVILNTDIGGDFDDLLALILAINTSDLVGVVTAKEHVRDKAKFAKKILDEGLKNVPVYYDGQNKKKRGKYIDVYDYNLLSDIDLRKSDKESSIHPNGIDFIIRKVHEMPGEINLISISSATNLSKAIIKDNSIVPKIKSLYIMGGAIYQSEIDLNRPEHNYLRDRKAFFHILDQNIDIRVVPRNITLDLFLDENIFQGIDTSFYNQIHVLGHRFLNYMKRDSFRLSDPMTLGSLLYPDLFKWMKAKYSTYNGRNGKVMLYNEDKKGKILVAYDFDRSIFYQRLVEDLTKKF